MSTPIDELDRLIPQGTKVSVASDTVTSECGSTHSRLAL